MHRVFHNFFQMFRRDKGAHFTYNLGVSFVRTGGLMLILLAAAVLFSVLAPPPTLIQYDTAEMSVNGVFRERKSTAPYLNDTRWLSGANYVVHLSGVSLEHGYEVGLSQQITKRQAEEYEAMISPDQEPKRYNVYYNSVTNQPYASLKDLKHANAEYAFIHLSYPAAVARSMAPYFFIIAILSFLLGAGQEKLAMKYPRSDVELEEHAIVLSDDETPVSDTDDLLREFEREYRKSHRNYVLDPPGNDDETDS